MNNYPTLNSEVEFIKHKNDLIDLIDLIISGAKLFDNRICDRFVCDIEYTLNPKPLLQPNDILKYVPQGINEESFFDTSCGYGVFADDDGNFMSAPPKLSILTPYSNTISYCISKILQHPGYKAHFGKCNSCGRYYFAGTKRQNRKYCSSHCRQKFNNDVRIHSGEHRRYKREKRAAGAKESYYG